VRTDGPAAPTIGQQPVEAIDPHEPRIRSEDRGGSRSHAAQSAFRSAAESLEKWVKTVAKPIRAEARRSDRDAPTRSLDGDRCPADLPVRAEAAEQLPVRERPGVQRDHGAGDERGEERATKGRAWRGAFRECI
jgi:hypothetical protein